MIRAGMTPGVGPKVPASMRHLRNARSSYRSTTDPAAVLFGIPVSSDTVAEVSDGSPRVGSWVSGRLVGDECPGGQSQGLVVLKVAVNDLYLVSTFPPER